MALQIPGTKPVSSELAFQSSEPGRSHVLEHVPPLPGSEEAGVSFDLPAQADTLHSANKVTNWLLCVFLLTRPVRTADVVQLSVPLQDAAHLSLFDLSPVS